MDGNAVLAENITVGDTTFEINAIFGEKTTLAQILADRALKKLEAQTPENKEKTACITDDFTV